MVKFSAAAPTLPALTVKRYEARSPPRPNENGRAAGSEVQPAGSRNVTCPVEAASALCRSDTSTSTRLMVADEGTTAWVGDSITARRGTLRTSRSTSPYGSLASRRLTVSRISIGTPSTK